MPGESGHQIPPRKKPDGDDDYFSVLTQAVFQAGFSWKVVRDRWPNFQQAFDGFSISKVARYDDHDLERLLEDEGIVRNGQKIQATIDNARTMRDLIVEHCRTEEQQQRVIDAAERSSQALWHFLDGVYEAYVGGNTTVQ